MESYIPKNGGDLFVLNKELYIAQGALVNSVGMDCTGISGGLICAYSLSAAFCEGVQFKGKMEPKRRC